MHPNPGRRHLPSALIALASSLAVLAALLVAVAPGAAAATLLSQGKPATASSAESAATSASAAVDGNTGTRWSSGFSDPQWIQVDLGASASVSQVVLQWEAAYGRAYQIQVSDDASTWRQIYSTTTSTGGTQTLDVSGTGRYVRLTGTQRATQYGYSLWEFQVYGTAGSAACGTANAALNRPATASSSEGAGTPASAAVDGNAATRWSSGFSDPQWLQVDLGSSAGVCQVTLQWEAAYARAFEIQVSDNASTWRQIYATTTSTGGTQTLNITGTGRYIRVYGTQRATQFGYSLFEFAVRTTGGGTTEPPPTGGGDLGPNVVVFDPSMSSASIQSRLDQIFAQQEANQFGSARYQLLFKPGTYNVNANIGFYTSINGLGRNPDDVVLNGGVWVDAGWFGGNATQNFWRSAENLSVIPAGGTARWAVAQAAPFRRMHVRGGLNLAPSSFGWASGGYIGDSKVDGQVQSISQQQWISRDSQFGSWDGSVWNMVFSGVAGAPAPHFPNPSHTVLDTSPVIREKPYLYVDSAGAYQVFVPSLRQNARGHTWASGATPGTSLPLSRFFVAKPGDSAATLNNALAQGLNLLFTPGIYHVNQTLNVTRPDTVVLGLGYATIIPDGGVAPMRVADVDGVKLAGLLFDAGTTNSPVLLEVGPAGSTAAHATNPTTIQDVFFRIGGAGAGKAANSLIVNSRNTIIDHIWAWRGDHGSGVGWTTNTADTGLTVNGDDVMAYGLFVEHYQKYNVIWNGQRGRTVFFQNELPYDPPNQAAYMNGSTRGYAAYKVGNGVTTHEAWGVGSYCNFNVDTSIVAERGFEVPDTAGVRFHNLLTVSLGGAGIINHVINNTGAVAQGTATIPSYLVSYP